MSIISVTIQSNSFACNNRPLERVCNRTLDQYNLADCFWQRGRLNKEVRLGTSHPQIQITIQRNSVSFDYIAHMKLFPRIDAC